MRQQLSWLVVPLVLPELAGQRRVPDRLLLRLLLRRPLLFLEQLLVDPFPVTVALLVQMPAKVFREAGGSAAAVRYPIATPGGAVTVFNLHLETPRHGVEFLLHDPAQAPKKIRANTLLRDTESRVVRRWVDSTTGARLVVGDFNLPVESAIFRHHWGDLEDAWAAAGNAFGYTKRNGWIRVRIDHTLSTGPLKAVRVKVGKDYGSDHLPVVTEYEY